MDAKRSIVVACVLALAACGFGDNAGRLAPGGSGTCGDGVVDLGEGCDDGNTVGNDGCSATCEVETPTPVCGNGVREVGEPCDDGNTRAGDGCSPDCQVESVCGNGVRESGEQCDDGNTAAGDGCSATCQIEVVDGACTVVPQDGCDPGDACDFGDPATGPFACRDVSAAGTADSKCATDDACAAGFTCVHDGSIAHCMQFCDSDNQCGANARCVIELVDDQNQTLPERVCSNNCDIETQTGCPAGLACIGAEDGAKDFSDCELPGTRANGTTCADSSQCRTGSLCVNVDGTATCHSYCNLGDPNSCDGGDACTDFSVALQIAGTAYGFCN